MTLHHATQPLLEVTGKLHGGRVPPICTGLHDYFRDVYDHLVRLGQSIDNLRDMVGTAISINLSPAAGAFSWPLPAASGRVAFEASGVGL